MTTTSPTTSPTPTNVPGLRQREAFASIEGELLAMSADALPRVRVDIRDAVVTVMGCAPELAYLAGLKGPKSTAASAFLLVELFRKNWSRIVGKTPVTIAELDQAEVLADRIEAAVGARDQGVPGAPEAALARLKTYALFLRAHDEARRVVGYLCWHEGDADQFLPSLYAAQGRRSSGSELPGTETGTGAQPMSPATVPGSGPGVGAAAPNGMPAGGTAPGLPGSSPFIDG